MGRKSEGSCAPFGGTESPSNTMLPRPRPTFIPSGILIHPAVWPQYTDVTNKTYDRQDRKRPGSECDTIYKVAQLCKTWCMFITVFVERGEIKYYNELFYLYLLSCNTLLTDQTSRRIFTAMSQTTRNHARMCALVDTSYHIL